jgi:methionine-rich copper-binding protein CopC
VRARLLGVASALAVLAAAPAARGIASGRSGAHDDAPTIAAARHLKLVRSEPAADSTVRTPPTTVKLWFSQRPELAVTRVVLTGATGAERVLAPLARGAAKDAPIEAPVGIALAAGPYTVTWRTMARDGHVLTGRFRFTVGGGAAATR